MPTTSAAKPTSIQPTVSPSSAAEAASATNGCSSCSYPTLAMPPSASPLFQAKKPRNMLNTDT